MLGKYSGKQVLETAVEAEECLARKLRDQVTGYLPPGCVCMGRLRDGAKQPRVVAFAAPGVGSSSALARFRQRLLSKLRRGLNHTPTATGWLGNDPSCVLRNGRSASTGLWSLMDGPLQCFRLRGRVFADWHARTEVASRRRHPAAPSSMLLGPTTGDILTSSSIIPLTIRSIDRDRCG